MSLDLDYHMFFRNTVNSHQQKNAVQFLGLRIILLITVSPSHLSHASAPAVRSWRSYR